MGRELEQDNPFSMGEISNLGFAREEDDLEYLKAWSRAAVSFYEAHRNAERDDKVKVAKWDKLMENLAHILDKDDLVVLEFD